MAPKITLYTFPMSQNAVRPEIALLEKGLEFDKVTVNLMEGEHRGAPFTGLTPRQQVPTLVYEVEEEPIVIYESIATIRFIDDLHPDPPLMPPASEPARRARALMRIEEFQAKLDPKNIFGSVVFRGLGKEELGDRIPKLVSELERWEQYIGDGPYLAGEQFTLADIAVFPLLLHFEALDFDYEQRTPALAAYIERCKQRESVRKTGWLAAFADFFGPRDYAKVLAS